MTVPWLTGERWRRLEALFIAASELAPAERQAFIDRETIDDAECRHHLIGMLAQGEGAGQAIVHAIEEVACAQAAPGSWIGRRLGGYRLTREVGRGGMGLVFEAVRDDDEFRKTVAVKIAPPWHDAALVGERFRLERQILAELEHPHIARFLDGGTDEGLPYFVMEYVDGVPITTYCADRRLDLRARLSLFRQVCAAVHFAHESLVVHRDLKPANILVTAAGVPKLLDFGIAKLLDPLASASMDATVAAAWTPDYTSPEQVRGRLVTTRTDVYSLGLILYEMLTGERGQRADSTTPLALDRSICETTPLRPSERLGAGHASAARKLRGDLDTIVMTAIRKEPERRYGTAAAFSDDIGRFLEDRPIVARPSTAWYRTRKFLGRHQLGAAAAVVVAVSIGGGSAAAVYQARRAERRFQQVRALANAFVFDVHDRIENLAGATEARRAIVQTALTYLESLRPDAAGDASLSRELAAAYLRIGNAQGFPLAANLGDTAGARTSYTRAIELLTPLADRGDREARRQLLPAITAIGMLDQAQGDGKRAIAAYGRAEAIGEALISEGPAGAELLSTISAAYAADTRTAVEFKEYSHAEASSRRTLQLMERVVALDPASGAHRDDLAMAYNALGQTLQVAGRLREAADRYREAIRVRESLVRDVPSNATFRRNLMVSYGNLGDVLGAQPENLGDTAGAIAALERAAAMAEASRQADSVDRRAWFDVVNAKYRLGIMLSEDPHRLDAALESFGDAERLTKRLREPEPDRLNYALLDGLIERRTGDALVLLGRTTAAERHYETARTIAAAWFAKPAAPRLRLVYVRAAAGLARLRAGAGDPRAGALADDAASELAKATGESAFSMGPAHRDVGAAYLALARHGATDRAAMLQTAVRHFEQSAAIWRAARVAPEAEPVRQKALLALDADLAACRRLMTTS